MPSAKILPPLVICVALAISPARATTDPTANAPQQPPRASSAAGAPAVDLQPVDGGVGYFGRFSNALPSSRDFFLIASWCRPVHEQAQVDEYQDFGLNTIICLENPELTDEALLRSNGLKAIVQSNERTRFNDIGSETRGWSVLHEIDMEQEAEYRCPAVVDQGVATAPNDGRLRHAVYGKGVGTWSERGLGGWTEAAAACYVNQPGLDLVSLDTYWLTDDNEAAQARAGHGYAYGMDVERLRSLDRFNGDAEVKPVFVWTELGPPGSGETRAPTPAGVRSAVWHQIIAGARGVAYFDHNFGTSTDPPTCHGSTIRGECYPEIRAMAKATNAQIKSLAPVLNSPFVTSGHSLSGAPTRRMVKWSGQNFYVFLATDNGGNATFTMQCIGAATATRLAPSNMPDETASIPVRDGSFTDQFADRNAVHIYRVEGGSDCGLPAGAGATGGSPGPESSQRRRARVGRLPRRVSLRSGRLRVPVRCTAACTVRSRLTTRIKSRRIVLASAQRRFSAGRHHIVLRLTRRDRRRVAGGRPMRLRTVIVQPGGAAQRIQRLVLRQR